MLDIYRRSASTELPQLRVTLQATQRNYRLALLDMREVYQQITDEVNYFGYPADLVALPAQQSRGLGKAAGDHQGAVDRDAVGRVLLRGWHPHNLPPPKRLVSSELARGEQPAATQPGQPGLEVQQARHPANVHHAGAGPLTRQPLGELLRPRGAVFVSTPNLLTLAPPGAPKSDNPWHLKEYRAEEFRRLCESVFGDVELLGLFHARMLRAHELALRAGWDGVHAALGITKPFYDRFTPAISARDFALRTGPLDRALDFVGVLRP